ncbi:MFS transporter [Pseudonocardia asaccharolytica]|uniref:Major facilitator superfamily (MFS) profile domain-containing protein n=1 Tax=Pseudonocardia asaccharolytica DSM 44247 = NBRC 16224 TaxID=1123024 RepID=A0A511D909_9PSEU|nr:MFS transporter [Pseudonocardia asaccharolytica]GEL20134.1 hypothetical protein PA7_39710 [Pseudonocardia asaccharolytica DSM 44247 = NBRC 16224]
MTEHRSRWSVWTIGLVAYLIGVMHRTSFGVAGLDAADRFGAAPAVLSGFVVLQLLVYASLQVPVGVLLDRFGARILVVTGALTMAAGQLLLALAASVPVAVLARVLVGAGNPAGPVDASGYPVLGHRQGTAVGIVNVGGFAAALLVMLAVGPGASSPPRGRRYCRCARRSPRRGTRTG